MTQEHSSTWRNFIDRLLGRGSAAIAVPVMDGALKPNRVLDQAEVVAELDGLDDLALDGGTLLASAGAALYRLEGGRLIERRRHDAPITAIAAQGGRIAIALAGAQVRLFDTGTLAETARLDTSAGQALHAVNALAFDAAGRLLISDGSARHTAQDWCRDLMTHGDSARVLRWEPASGVVQTLASGLRYCAGVLAQGDAVLASESWRHRVLTLDDRGAGRALSGELPGYPSRMAPASGGGFWLTCFVCRTQLVEFVLREHAYRRRMLAEVDPRYWIAPALSSGHDFLEPLQGAGVKQMGVLKPWAPPRSYGLVVRVDAQGRVNASMHSQVDGTHHGITAVAEHGGALYAVSRGSARLLRVPFGDGP
jgi:hypothetical protein